MSNILEGQRIKILRDALDKESELISQIKFKMPDQPHRASTTLAGNSSHIDNNESKDTLMEPSQHILHENLIELNPSIQVIVKESKLIPHIPSVKKETQTYRSSSTSKRN